MSKSILRSIKTLALFIGGKERLIVKVDFAQGASRKFETFFDGKMFNSAKEITVIQALKDAVTNSPSVHKAIHHNGN